MSQSTLMNSIWTVTCEEKSCKRAITEVKKLQIFVYRHLMVKKYSNLSTTNVVIGLDGITKADLDKNRNKINDIKGMRGVVYPSIQIPMNSKIRINPKLYYI